MDLVRWNADIHAYRPNRHNAENDSENNDCNQDEFEHRLNYIRAYGLIIEFINYKNGLKHEQLVFFVLRFARAGARSCRWQISLRHHLSLLISIFLIADKPELHY